jgi:hypothetical protein
MPISTQKHKKGEQRGGELPHKDKTWHTLTFHISPLPPLKHLPPDMLSFPPPNLVVTHHGSKNTTPPLPSKTDRQGTRKRGGSFFPSQKQSNHRFVWIYWLEDAKETQQNEFDKNHEFDIKTKINKKACFRKDKKLSQRKRNKIKNKRFLFGHFFYLTMT